MSLQLLERSHDDSSRVSVSPQLFETMTMRLPISLSGSSTNLCIFCIEQEAAALRQAMLEMINDARAK